MGIKMNPNEMPDDPTFALTIFFENGSGELRVDARGWSIMEAYSVVSKVAEDLFDLLPQTTFIESQEGTIVFDGTFGDDPD